MPKSVVNTPDTPQELRAYVSLGIDLHLKGDEAVADCPFCGREEKFHVNKDTGIWRCLICAEGSDKGGGNIYTFLRLLHEKSRERTDIDDSHYEELRLDRCLMSINTLKQWGLCKSVITDEWLIPGYNLEGKLTQLYRYVPFRDRMAVMATAELSNTLFGVNLYDASKPDIYLVEGIWDAVCLWEMLERYRKADDTSNRLILTGNKSSSLIGSTSVMAVPGSGTFNEQWTSLFSNKRVWMLYDSDHPKKNPTTGKEIPPAGYTGLHKTAIKMLACEFPPTEIRYLKWGEEGYDPRCPSGTDIRDVIAKSKSNSSNPETLRARNLEAILDRCEAIPNEWIEEASKQCKEKNQELTPLKCHTWSDLRNTWKKGLLWRRDLDDVLSVMLAVAISTDQQGDQLLLQVVGAAGSAKSRMGEGMLVSKHCYPLDQLTGFTSGWNDGTGKDYSLIGRINHHCLITTEGDVISSLYNFDQIMSQMRKMFDGSFTASFKHKEDTTWSGLRTPWIMCGTPVMIEKDQTRLGDRFLKIYIAPPCQQEEDDILRRVGFTAIRSVINTSNGQAETSMEERIGKAYRMTGGYVDYLFANASNLLRKVHKELDQEQLVDDCATLARFTANLRARPNPSWLKYGKAGDKDSEAVKELPTRLTHQFNRLSVCLAAVLNRRTVDSEVMRRVAKVAIDTAKGVTMRMVAHLRKFQDKGLTCRGLANLMGYANSDRTQVYLDFLRQIQVVSQFVRPVNRSGVRSENQYRLTNRMLSLYDDVMNFNQENISV